MSKEEVDSNIRWFTSVIRQLGFTGRVEVKENSNNIESAKSWLKEPINGIKQTEAERILAMYLQMLENSPGNATILDKIRKHRSKYGLWD